MQVLSRQAGEREAAEGSAAGCGRRGAAGTRLGRPRRGFCCCAWRAEVSAAAAAAGRARERAERRLGLSPSPSASPPARVPCAASLPTSPACPLRLTGKLQRANRERGRAEPGFPPPRPPAWRGSSLLPSGSVRSDPAGQGALLEPAGHPSPGAAAFPGRGSRALPPGPRPLLSRPPRVTLTLPAPAAAAQGNEQ